MPATVATPYTIFRPDYSQQHGSIDWPAKPGYDLIRAFVEPLLGDLEPMEHVTVLFNGKHLDMFVSEYGHMLLTSRPPLPINPTATFIYRNNWLTQHPGTNPDTLSAIAGTAILFHRRIWS